MEPDASDILGQDTMPIATPARRGIFSLSPGQYICASIALYGLYAFGVRLWNRLMLWRERSLKLATRRRHGIPDSDLRPFNVAYSEAANRAREEENQLKPRPSRPQPSIVDLREASHDQILRNRSGHEPIQDVKNRNISQYSEVHRTEYSPSELRNETDYSLPSPPYVEPASAGYFTHAPVPPQKVSRHGARHNVEEGSSDRKRSYDEEIVDEEREAKKTRLHDEINDHPMDADENLPRRGAKRVARDEDDDDDDENGEAALKSARGKRARKVSRGDSTMDIDVNDEEVDEVTELKPIGVARGKKRDRAAAGSTFGGDDDDDDAGSAGEFENDKVRRRRKRRTVTKRKSEAIYARGKKRDREGSDESDEEQVSGESSPERRFKTSRDKKRGKRGSMAPGQAQALRRYHITADDDGSDVSMDDSVATSIRITQRNVGDEWKSNGIWYRVGPNYQRLRMVLIKKAETRYSMPRDSQHPDRHLNHHVCIEAWLTEEEYLQAKAKHLLSWQDDLPGDRGKLNLDISSMDQDSVPFPHGSNVPGKSLLWVGSTTTTPTLSPTPQSPPPVAEPLAPTESFATPATPVNNGSRHGKSYRETYRHSIATTVGLPISPFSNAQIPTAKRIASTTRALSVTTSASGSPADVNGNGTVPSSPVPGLSDSTNSGTASPRSLKVFSKWEKQELEARAMMKIREANRRKEMEKESRFKEEREKQERAERERQERTRLEREARERVEKERQERQEKEKKEKEAQQQKTATTSTAPAVASTGGFNFTAPTASGAGDVSSLPFGSFNSEAKPAAPAASSTFSFGPSTSGASSSAPKAKTSSLADAPLLGSSGVTESKKDEGGASLFARLGPPAPASTEPAKPATGASLFSFSAPKQESTASFSANPFGAPAPSAASSATSTAPAAHKFSFDFGGKTTTGASDATNTAGTGNTKPSPSPFGAPPSSSTLSGALGSDTSKAAPSASAFSGFKTPGAPASAINGSSAAATGAAPLKFNFAMPASTTPSAFAGGSSGSAFSGGATGATHSDSAKSVFGGEPAKSVFGNTSTAAKDTTKSAFSTGFTAPNNDSVKSAFGGSGTTTLAFGSTSGQSAFGNAASTGQSVFGSNAGSSAKSVFGGNANSSTPSPFGAPASQTSNVFGGGAAKTTTGDKVAEFKNPFGLPAQPSNTSSTPAATPATSTTSTPLKFSFAPTTSTPAANSNTAASAAATTTPASGSTPSAAPFTFNFGPTPAASSTTPAASPFAAFAAPSGASTQSAFRSNTKPSVFGSTTFGSTENKK